MQVRHHGDTSGALRLMFVIFLFKKQGVIIASFPSLQFPQFLLSESKSAFISFPNEELKKKKSTHPAIIVN